VVLTRAPECYIMFFRLVNMSVLFIYIGCVPARWLEFLAVGSGGASCFGFLVDGLLFKCVPAYLYALGLPSGGQSYSYKVTPSRN
jgi:hypothetical protein